MRLIIIVIMVDFGIRYIGKIDTVIIIIASFNSGQSINNMNRHGITAKAAENLTVVEDIELEVEVDMSS